MKAYNRYLRDLIVSCSQYLDIKFILIRIVLQISGKAKPSFVVSNEIGIDEAVDAYDKFDRRVDGYTKVLIHPNGPLN